MMQKHNRPSKNGSLEPNKLDEAFDERLDDEKFKLGYHPDLKSNFKSLNIIYK